MALYATAELRRAVADLGTEVVERRAIEERLRESEARVRSIVESSPMGIHLYRLEAPGRLVLTGSNPAGDRILGIPVGPLVAGQSRRLFPAWPAPRSRTATAGSAPKEARGAEVTYRDDRFRGMYEVNAFQTAPGMMAVMFLDVTERRQAEEERRRLEEQLRQSQKMEAVGRLAGGIAHDFNNLLTVILGHGELLRRSLDADDPRLRKVQHVMGAARAGRAPVRQLLAFSRKQVLEPQVVDLNAVVADTERMLRPLLGEDVEVVTRLDPPRARRASTRAVEQVLMNLAVNARDAMPAGGTLTLETGRRRAWPASGEAAPGALRGADRARHRPRHGRRRRAPTSSSPSSPPRAGRGGTGLGLATVYGIVQQSGGPDRGRERAGRGTAFRILLPRADGAGRRGRAGARRRGPRRGGETILVVEDEPASARSPARCCEAHGYRALGAASGEEALGLAVRHRGPDRPPADRRRDARPRRARPGGALRRRPPDARVLYMSGYAGDDLARRGVAEDAAHVPAKPFSADLLCRRVREALEG